MSYEDGKARGTRTSNGRLPTRVMGLPVDPLVRAQIAIGWDPVRTLDHVRELRRVWQSMIGDTSDQEVAFCPTHRRLHGGRVSPAVARAAYDWLQVLVGDRPMPRHAAQLREIAMHFAAPLRPCSYCVATAGTTAAGAASDGDGDAAARARAA